MNDLSGRYVRFVAASFSHARNQFSSRSVWSDVLHGAGLAYDPLPSATRCAYIKSDQAAFESDLFKLIKDRHAALLPSTCAGFVDNVTAERVTQPKVYRGEVTSPLCEAE